MTRLPRGDWNMPPGVRCSDIPGNEPNRSKSIGPKRKQGEPMSDTEYEKRYKRKRKIKP